MCEGVAMSYEIVYYGKRVVDPHQCIDMFPDIQRAKIGIGTIVKCTKCGKTDFVSV